MTRKNKGLTSKQMSQLHWQLRKKGKTYQQAKKITGKAKRISKKTIYGKQKWLKKKYPYMDFDQDGKINKYDCQPLNKKKQDLDEDYMKTIDEIQNKEEEKYEKLKDKIEEKKMEEELETETERLLKIEKQKDKEKQWKKEREEKEKKEKEYYDKHPNEKVYHEVIPEDRNMRPYVLTPKGTRIYEFEDGTTTEVEPNGKEYNLYENGKRKFWRQNEPFPKETLTYKQRKYKEYIEEMKRKAKE